MHTYRFNRKQIVNITGKSEWRIVGQDIITSQKSLKKREIAQKLATRYNGEGQAYDMCHHLVVINRTQMILFEAS